MTTKLIFQVRITLLTAPGPPKKTALLTWPLFLRNLALIKFASALTDGRWTVGVWYINSYVSPFFTSGNFGCVRLICHLFHRESIHCKGGGPWEDPDIRWLAPSVGRQWEDPVSCGKGETNPVWCFGSWTWRTHSRCSRTHNENSHGCRNPTRGSSHLSVHSWGRRYQLIFSIWTFFKVYISHVQKLNYWLNYLDCRWSLYQCEVGRFSPA